MNRISYLVALLIACGLLSGTTCLAQARADSTPVIVQTTEIPTDMSVPDLESKGDALRREKAYQEALAYYRAALLKDKKNAVLFNKAGIAELHLVRLQDAQNDFKRATKQDRNYAEAHNNLGVVAYMQGNYRTAIKQYQKALKLRETASFHSNLGAAYFAQKQMEPALAAYNRALELDPDILIRTSAGGIAAQIASPEDRAHYWFTLAKLYARRRDTERCVHCLQKAQEAGYAKLQDVNRDPEFVSVRQDPRVLELLAPNAPE